MFWLTKGNVLFKRRAEEEAASLANVEIAQIRADEDGAELWDCNVLELTGTNWLKLGVTLWDAGSDLFEYDTPLTVTDREPFTDALSENALGLSVCETLLDALAFWIEAEKKVEASRTCGYLDTCKRPEFDRAVFTKYIPGIYLFKTSQKHTHQLKRTVWCKVELLFSFL